MQQLTELDGNFLLQETPCTPMHISPVVIYEQARGKRRVGFEQVLELFKRNLHKSAIFRRKLAGGAMGLDTPYWVEDPNFELEFHVRQIALPKPGTWRDLFVLLARLHSQGLDLTRPLWEAYVIGGVEGLEGLPRNSFAIMFKVHHSAIDGVSGAEIVTAIHSLSPAAELAEVSDAWHAESDPPTWRVWWNAYIHNLKRPARFIEAARHIVPDIIHAAREAQSGDGADSATMVRTRFNGEVSSARIADAVVFDLAKVKALRKSVTGATVNDVMISIIGGGLRKYLLSKDELPEVSLACHAPVSTRDERNSESTGNQVSEMMISMATDMDAPLQRLRAVHESALKAKEFTATVGGSLMSEVSRSLIPAVLGAGLRAASLAGARANIPVPAHVVISNIPGPQFPLYLGNAKVHVMLGLGPLLHLMGMFHAVLSGVGRISITFVTCPEMIPDPEFYRQCLQEAYDELEKACSEETGPP
jgi:WS/DGAT/MGAT family acyltransferase